MPQYDYAMKWSSITAARADAIALAEMQDDDFNVKQFVQDHIIPGLKVWRASQDTVDVDGNTIHNYLPGYFAIISVNRRIPAIENSSALQFAIDRDKMNAGISPFIFKSNLSNALLLDIRFEPVFSGMNIPWGGS